MKNFKSKMEFKLHCLEMDEIITQQIVNADNKNKLVCKCAQNLDERKYLENLSWEFDGISTFGGNKSYQMVKLFTPKN